MLRSLILWKITKVAYITAFTLAFLLLMVQIFRIGFILFGMPPTASLPYFLTWFAYFGFFFIPDGVLVATALTLYELKEKRLIHVLYSFHLSPAKLFFLFLLPVALFFSISLFLSFLLFEEHVSFLRRGLLIEYRDRVFNNLPEKTFLNAHGLVVYVRERDGSELRDVFLRYKGTYVIAEKARYEGNGRFVFERGSLLTQERGKYFLVGFEEYRLDTEEFISARLRDKKIEEGRVLNLINSLSIIPFFLFSFFGTLYLCETHSRAYYLVALGVVLRQLLMFGVKISL